MWDLSSLTPEQHACITDALNRTKFDWNLMAPGLLTEVGKTAIPVEFIDCARFAQSNDEPKGARLHKSDDEFDLVAGEIDGRRAALGLAWYSGKVSIEQSLLPGNYELAIEVFLAEGAHMIDFFYMSDDQRTAIKDVYAKASPDPDGVDDWFEENGEQDYWSWIGESFMSGFTMAYGEGIVTALESRQPWVHRTTPEIAAQIRSILGGYTRDTAHEAFGFKRGKVYHKHDHYKSDRSAATVTWSTEAEAIAAGRKLCRWCRLIDEKS